MLELIRQRAGLIDCAEDWLASQGELTSARKSAIDLAVLRLLDVVIRDSWNRNHQA
jgi:hypothetical protein